MRQDASEGELRPRLLRLCHVDLCLTAPALSLLLSSTSTTANCRILDTGMLPGSGRAMTEKYTTPPALPSVQKLESQEMSSREMMNHS